MPVTVLSFHVKVRSMRNAKERKNSWEFWEKRGEVVGLRNSCRSYIWEALKWQARGSGLYRRHQKTMSSAFTGPWRWGQIFKGLASVIQRFRSLRGHWIVSLHLRMYKLYCCGAWPCVYGVYAEFQSRCGYDPASGLENGMNRWTERAKPSVFGKEARVPWLSRVFLLPYRCLPLCYLEMGRPCTQLVPFTHKWPGTGKPSAAACTVTFDGLKGASVVS